MIRMRKLRKWITDGSGNAAVLGNGAAGHRTGCGRDFPPDSEISCEKEIVETKESI